MNQVLYLLNKFHYYNQHYYLTIDLPVLYAIFLLLLYGDVKVYVPNLANIVST